MRNYGDQTKPTPDDLGDDAALAPPPLRRALPRIAVRLAVVIGAAIVLNFAIGWLLTQIATMNSISGASSMIWMILIVLIGYAILIAIPFVPGVEVGIALLLLQGSAIAPFVYLATVLGLILAYTIGRMVPMRLLHDTFRDLHMNRACQLIADIEKMSPSQRLKRLQERLPPTLAAIAVNYRYLMLAALINLPGTFAIGGGGGILMFAGITRLFQWRAVFLTVGLATLPIPLMVYFFGTVQLLYWID